MERKIRTTLPTLEKNLQPRWPNRKSVMLKDKIEKDRQAFYYNRCNGATNLSTLRPGDTVLTKLDHEKVWASPAVIRQETVTPRSFVIETEQGAVLRRNRCHLQAVPTPTQTVHTDSPQTKGTVDNQPTRTDTTETVQPKTIGKYFLLLSLD